MWGEDCKLEQTGVLPGAQASISLGRRSKLTRRGAGYPLGDRGEPAPHAPRGLVRVWRVRRDPLSLHRDWGPLRLQEGLGSASRAPPGALGWSRQMTGTPCGLGVTVGACPQ